MRAMLDRDYRANNDKEGRVYHYGKPLRLRERISLRFMGWRDGKRGIVREVSLGCFRGGLLEVFAAQLECDRARNESIACADLDNLKKRKASLSERNRQIEANKNALDVDMSKAYSEIQDLVRCGEEGLSDDTRQARRKAEVEREFAFRIDQVKQEELEQCAILQEVEEIVEEEKTRGEILAKQIASVENLSEIRRSIYLRSAMRAVRK